MKRWIVGLMLTATICQGRTWEDDSGRTFEGWLRSVSGRTATIRKAADGKDYQVSTAILSEPCRKWVTGWELDRTARWASVRVIDVTPDGALCAVKILRRWDRYDEKPWGYDPREVWTVEKEVEKAFLSGMTGVVDGEQLPRVKVWETEMYEYHTVLGAFNRVPGFRVE